MSNNGGASYGPWGPRAANTVLPADTVRGQKWQCQARGTDGTLASAWYISPTTITIANSAPGAPTAITFAPLTPADNADVTPTASGAVDPDGDTLSYQYEWAVSFDSGATWTGFIFANPILPAVATEPGDRWKCQARAFNGYLYSGWYESPTIVTIGGSNLPPSAPTSIVFAPPAPTGADNITATASGSIDPEAQPVTYEYQWAKSTDSGATWSGWIVTGQVLGAANTAVGERWKCRARASDGTQFSAWYDSPTIVTIQNSPPSTPTLASITPGAPLTTDDLAAVVGGSVDPDGDAITYQCQWRSSNDGGATWSAWGHDGMTLPAALTTRGEQWQMWTRASDGVATSAWLTSAAVTIGNSPPTNPAVPVINPASPVQGNALSIVAGGSTDADGDPISYVVAWYFSTDAGATWTLSNSPTSNGGQTLGGGAVLDGQQWKAAVQASDGVGLSAWVESAPVTVSGAPPTRPTLVTISPNPAGPDLDLTASASGSTDATGNPVSTYEYQWRRSVDSGVTWGAWTAGTSVLPAAQTVNGDYWQARARASAGGLFSTWLASDVIGIFTIFAGTTPADGATNVDTATGITMNLNYPALPTSFQANFSLAPSGGGAAVAGTFTWPTTKQVIFKPSAPLSNGVQYVATLTAPTLQRSTRPPLTWSESFSFTTTAVAPLTIVSATPTGTNVPTNTPIEIVFSEPMNAAATEASVFLKPTGMALTKSWPNPSTLRITNWKGIPWPASTLITVKVRDTAASATGQLLGYIYTFSFTTGTGPAMVMSVASVGKTTGPAAVTVNLSAAAEVEMTVLNMAGRVIARTAAQALQPGSNTLYWDGRSLSGTKVPVGTYLVRVTAHAPSGEKAECLVPLQR